MMNVPNRLGPMTSRDPARIVAKRSSRVRTRPSRCCSAASSRRQFSTMMTAPSTMMPKSMAPRLIRLALTLFSTMPVIANSIDKRNDARGRDGRPDVSEDQEQNGDHQDGAFEEIVLTVAMVASTRWVRS